MQVGVAFYAEATVKWKRSADVLVLLPARILIELVAVAVIFWPRIICIGRFNLLMMLAVVTMVSGGTGSKQPIQVKVSLLSTMELNNDSSKLSQFFN